MTFTPDATHDPDLGCWVTGAPGHASFPVQNLPYGVFSPRGEEPRAGVAIGDRILDLRATAAAGLLPNATTEAVAASTLNPLMARSSAERTDLRGRLSQLLSDPAFADRLQPQLHEAGVCALHLPAHVGDYTDFYAGIHHATAVGALYRPDDPLTPNYKHLPVGYHGRASSIRASGAPVTRPHGQVHSDPALGPRLVVSAQLDYELELGVWIGPGNALGDPIPIGRAAEHIVGVCLLNDWSARDVQGWERTPLGPFLGKSFITSVSPWVITAEALAPFRIAPMPRPPGDPAPQPYLRDVGDEATGQFAIELEASLLTPVMREAGLAPFVLSRARSSDLYWSFAQLVAHQTSNGCNLLPGDLLGTGTISGVGRDRSGSLFEITAAGRTRVTLPSGETRAFLEDGDEVILEARANADGYASIGFGACRGVIQPARAGAASS